MDDGKAAVSRHRGRQPPDGNRVLRTALDSGRLADLIEDLPSKRAAFFPASAFRPGEQHFAVAVDRECRVLAAFAVSRRRLRFRKGGRPGPLARKVDLVLCLPGGEYAVWALRERH